MSHTTKDLTYFTSQATKDIKKLRKHLAYVTIYPVVMVALALGVFYGSLYNNGTKAATGLTPTPTQPAGFFYNTEPSAAWGQPGSLVIAGRDNFAKDGFKNVSSKGGTVLIYLDTVLYSPTFVAPPPPGTPARGYDGGRYHAMLYFPSVCGSATVKQWPGTRAFNTYGQLADTRPGSAMQTKLECVLETMVKENPHMGGFFADDLGSSNGNTQAGAPAEEFYQAAVSLSKTFRKVADRHGLMFVPNGAWEGGRNGGYPTRNISGNALADGSCVEHHSAGELNYWKGYLTTGQWAAQSALTRGTPFHIIITYPGADFNAYKGANLNGFIANQSDYSNAGNPWGANPFFHASGLPNKPSGAATPVPPPAPGPPPAPAPPPSTNPNPTAKPFAPTGVALTPGDRKLVVSWSASPANEKVDNYQVYLNGAFTYATTSSPTYTITGTPGQTYSVRVSAHNSAGFGPWTASLSGVIGSSPGAPAPPVIPAPKAPPVAVPGANPKTPVTIPKNIPADQSGTIIADFTGDGSNDIARDTNNDGAIDPLTELFSEETTTASTDSVSHDTSSYLNDSYYINPTSDKGTITLNGGPIKDVTIPKPVAYTFLTAQTFAMSGLAAYFAITKLALLAGLRGRLGL